VWQYSWSVAGVSDSSAATDHEPAHHRSVELYDGVDRTMSALDQLAVLIESVDDLGPLARRALQSKVSRAVRRD
jgi:hypothetical protein